MVLWIVLSVLVALLVGSVWLNVVVIRRNLTLSDQRDELVDKIEEGLDTLDNCYARLVHHSQIPVLSDDPIIQDVVNDIQRARNAVLKVASLIVTYGEDEEEKQETEEQ